MREWPRLHRWRPGRIMYRMKEVGMGRCGRRGWADRLMCREHELLISQALPMMRSHVDMHMKHAANALSC